MLPVLPPNGRWESTRPDDDGQPEVGPYDLRLPEDQNGLRPDWVHLRTPVVERVAGLDEQEIEDPEQGFEETEDPLADLMREFWEDADRIHAEPLPFPGGDELVAGLARPFAREGGDGWERLAREVGLDVAADDFRAALRSLAELAWEVDPYEGESAAGVLPRMQRLRVLIEAGFDDGRPGAAFYDRSLHDLRGLVADLADPMFNPVTGQHGAPQPEEVSDGEVRRWIDRMRLALHLGGVGADLVGGRRGLRVIRLAEQLYGETPDETTFYDLAWLAGQLDPEASNISALSLTNMMAGFDGGAGRYASRSEMRDLVGLAGRAREILGRLDSVQAHADVDAGADGGQRVTPVQALEAMWNADLPWRQIRDRLVALEVTARVNHDEQIAEWARGVLAGFEDARSVVVREPAELQARLNAVVLPSFVTMIAEPFGGGWSGLAAEIGLGDGTGLPADYRQSLENLAELYWDLDPDLSGFDEALLWMRRIRVLIDTDCEDGGEGAGFYKWTVDDLQTLVTVAHGPVFNPETGQQELRSPGDVEVGEIRLWLELMDVVHNLGGYHELVSAVGADLVGGRRLFPVIRLTNDFYIEPLDMDTFHSLAWLANQLDAESSTISLLSSLTRMVAGFEGRSAGDVDFGEVRDLVSLVGRAREDLGRVDRDPKKALEAMWNADTPWQRMGDRLAKLVETARDEPTVEWARGVLAGFEDARSVVVREPVESQARLNAVVLAPFVTRIAERFGGGWREVAAEIGLGDGTGLPADFEQSLLNLAELYWEVDPDLSRFDKAPLWLRRIRVLIDLRLRRRQGGCRLLRPAD